MPRNLGKPKSSDVIEQDQEEEPPSSAPVAELSILVNPSTTTDPIVPLIYSKAFSNKRKSMSRVECQSRVVPSRRSFRKRFFPEVTDQQWNNWQWQIRNRICQPEQLKRFLTLSPEEEATFVQVNTKLPLAITPYYLSLLPSDQPDHPLRRCMVPTVHELFQTNGEENDPLGEEGQSPVPGLVHRYPDRVLLLVIDFCAAYCRYCTRSRVVGHGLFHPGGSRLEKAIAYIRANPTIRDVLLSGGDPLTLSDRRIDWLLTRLREIPHVEIIRIGTKTPAVLPQRITPQLVKILRKHHPLWMSLHFTHPEEATPETQKACNRLADAGIPLGSQTVLLKGINDNVETMKQLMHRLMQMRVRPYYLYQCDPVSGTAHLRTSVSKGLEIIRGLRGHTSGYAVPNYVIDAPGGGGKIPLMPDYVIGRTDDDLWLCNYENKIFRYPDTVGSASGFLKKKEQCKGSREKRI